MSLVTDRREFVRLGIGALVGVNARRVPWSGAPRDYATAVVMDSLATDTPEFDAQAALNAGITGAIVDMSLYPRTFTNAVHSIAQWNAKFREPGTLLIRVTRVADIDAAKRDKKLAIVLACQDAAILDSSTASVSTYNLDNLALFYDLGLRVLQLTHNDRNSVGDSFREKVDAGLSRLGEQVVDAMSSLGMIVDLSHCSRRTTLDAVALSRRPCAITHAGCRALYDTPRNKTDEEIRAVAARGGFFGVFNMSNWLTTSTTPSLDHVLDHIAHAVRVAGVDHVGFGSDGPMVAQTSLEPELRSHQEYARANLGLPSTERIPDHVRIPELNSPRRLEHVATGLARRGFKEADIDKIVGGNVKRLIRDVCG